MAKGLVKLKIIKKSEIKLDLPDNTHPPTDHFFLKNVQKTTTQTNTHIRIWGFFKT